MNRGGRGGGRGGWRGRGRGRSDIPVAKDDDGKPVQVVNEGPPPMYPEMELPHRADEQPAFHQLLYVKRNELVTACRASPFVLECKDDKAEDVESCIEREKEAVLVLAQQQGGGGRSRKRRREPLTSVVKLLPEYQPEELYSNSDRRYAKLQETYWRRAASKKDDNLQERLDALAQLEKAGAGKAGAAGQEEEGEGGAEAEEELHDTDEEEDMENDDYYKGEHFDDDEGYDDGFDDGGGGGDEGGFF